MSDERVKRRGYVLGAVGLVLVSAFAVVVALRTDPSSLGTGSVDPARFGQPVPSLRNAGEWLNSPPLTSTELAGKVVVYDFWTYSCVNCVRTMPYLRSWWDRYQADGLVIVGVHTPEFAFERRRANVEAAAARLGVTWPVTLDNGRAVWTDFRNNWWPAKYVADRDGKLRYQHIGEGAYEETEDVLRGLLGVPADAPRAVRPGKEDDLQARARAQISPETYLGVLRSGGGTHPGVDTYADPGAGLVLSEPRLVGTWDGDDERATSVSDGAAIVLRYRAREVNLVLSAEAPLEVVVELDGRPVPADVRGADVREAAGAGAGAAGATVVRVDRPDMYRLVLGARVEEHTIRLTPRSPGLEAYAFTFGA